MDIREIEKYIDDYHKNHRFLSGNKAQLIYELLVTFEDLCMCSFMASVLNPMALRKITDYMDALNQALLWVEMNDSLSTETDIETEMTEHRYNLGSSFLTEYAFPYSVICSGYIFFSRERFLSEVNDNVVTFMISKEENNSVWTDILREAGNMGLSEFMSSFNPISIMRASAKLQEKISVQDKQLCYELDSEILNPFLEIAEKQWNATKTLPDSWKFDQFTMREYKEVWVAITALSYIHFFSCITIKDPLIRLKNALIIQSIESIIGYVESISGIDKNRVEGILKYLSFEPTKRNVDIMYQPIVQIQKEMVLIAPMLFMGSKPERNLLAVVSSKSDFEHSKEVNDLEDIMVNEIEKFIPKSNSVKVIKHKKLGGRLPDIDLGIYDEDSSSVLLCELKWFLAADSPREVDSREKDITHGCEQSEQIMAYAMSDKKQFMKHVFEVADGDNIDLFCCVVAKNNIRTKNRYVPVINEKTIKELLSNKSLNTVFHIIRNHEYEEALPDDAEITYQTVEYGGYIFKIPAICFGSMPEL